MSNSKQYDFTYTEVVRLAGDKDGFVLRWGANNFGFGEICFVQNDGKIEIHAETLSKDFVRQALEHMLNNAELVE